MPSSKSRLCVSLLPESDEQLYSWLPLIKNADMVEVRLDRVPDLNLRRLRKAVSLPLILTLRHREQGGFFEGAPEKALQVYRAGVAAGADYVDLDVGLARAFFSEQGKHGRTGIIISAHVPAAGLEALLKSAARLTQWPADVYKFVYQAETINDALHLVAIRDLLARTGRPAIVHAMGEAGRPSRFLGALEGNAWTYVCLTPSSQTAGGQVCLEEVRDGFFLHRKKRPSGLLGLVGYPIGQSKGWLLHNRLIEALKAEFSGNGSPYPDYLYLNFPVPEFESFWEKWQHRLHGISVTIPHKEALAQVVPLRSREVRISCVANTAVRTEQGWMCFNTDLLALESILRERLEKLQGGVLILGTGATARSLLVAAKRLGIYPIVLVGRNLQRGEKLARMYGVDFLTFQDISGVSCSLICNTTPLGMYPDVDRMPPAERLLKPGRLVFDAVYNPETTRFLALAQERGCETIPGTTLFLRQAALQFELFTGIRPQPDLVARVWKDIQRQNGWAGG
ncbi:MAG: type I 3-dehydroquinate dehydratase [Calditrichaeota bacterium]|nr:MAG: type I 3-dehydroquinate dehydratase [Calditrichota bacterium]